MSDTSYKTQGSRQDSSLTDKASALARDVKEQASNLADQTSSQVRNQAAGLTDGAKEMASSAGDKLRHAAEEQKKTGAQYVSGMAGAIRQAAGGFDDQLPQAAQYIRQAAEQVDALSDALQRRDLNELFGQLQGFARRQPTAFLGATFLAGFAAVRFLKSSMPAGSASHQGGQSHHPFAGDEFQGAAPRSGSPSPYGGTSSHQGRGEDLRGHTSSPSVAPDRPGM